jgi:multiple sugar transport system permease protein
MSLWGVGTWAIILLAGLQSVPQHLYEAAELDGAHTFQKFRHITVPMLSPVLFFNLVMSLIGGFQYFAQVYIIGGGEGAPAGSLRLYSLYLFNLAFGLFKMGYASALAWVLFLLILLATLLVFRTVGRSIYYEGR